MEAKKACLVYVPATAAAVADAKAKLEAHGYEVCSVEATEEEAGVAQAGQAGLPPALEACITSSDVCIFLLPLQPSDDELLGAGAGLADACSKPIIGIIEGSRSVYPEEFQDAARSMLRTGSGSLADALAGEEVWEDAKGTRVVERPFKTVRCQ